MDGTLSFPSKPCNFPAVIRDNFSHTLFWSCPSIYLVPLLGRDILSHFEASLSLPPITSPDSRFVLPQVASQIPTPVFPVPTLPDPFNPQVLDISTPMTASHYQMVLVCLNDPFSFSSRPQFLITAVVTSLPSPSSYPIY